MKKSFSILLALMLGIFVLSATATAEPPDGMQYKYETKTNHFWSWATGFSYKYFFKYFNGEDKYPDNKPMLTDPDCDQDQLREKTREQLREDAERLRKRDRIMQKEQYRDGSCEK